MLLGEIIKAYEEKVPLSLSLPIDHNGLKLGNVSQDVKKVLACLELTPEVAKYAVEQQVDCLFVHHDPFFLPFYDLRADNAHAQTVLRLVQHDIALYASHTNLDVVSGGLNDYIFTALGGVDAHILEPATGIGRYGSLKDALPLSKYIKAFVDPLQTKYRVIAGDTETLIKKIAVVNGSGASYFMQALDASVDLFITGDVDYHSAMLAREYNLPVLDIGHDIEYLCSEVFNRLLYEIKDENHGDFAVVTDVRFDFSPW